MTHASLIERVKAWLAAKLGKRYPIIVDTFDRALSAFVVTMLGRIVLGDGLDVRQLLHLSWWHTAALAGVAAAVSVIKSAGMAAWTGDAALLSPISTTLRARRSIMTFRPRHAVPLRPRKDHPKR